MVQIRRRSGKRTARAHFVAAAPSGHCGPIPHHPAHEAQIMDLSLAGRRALVTGSTAGIGLAIARELALLGATVAINGRGEKRVAEAIAGLKDAVPGGRFLAAPGDVGGAAGAEAVLKALQEADILINNAGIFEPKPFFAIEDE